MPVEFNINNQKISFKNIDEILSTYNWDVKHNNVLYVVYNAYLKNGPTSDKDILGCGDTPEDAIQDALNKKL